MWALIARNLLRQPMRLALSGGSLTLGLLLLMLLQSIAVRFAAGADSDDPRLIVLPKHRSGYRLPLPHLERIRAVDGVVAVTPIHPLHAYHRDPANAVGTAGVYADQFVRMVPNAAAHSASLERFANTRTGAVISRALADATGWQVGDVVPLHSRTYMKADRTRVWTFEIIDVSETRGDAALLYFHFDYLSESLRRPLDGTSIINVLVADGVDPWTVARRIDEVLAVTPEPTTTVPSGYASRSWARQLGNVGRIVTLILGAVLFSVLIVAANAAVQAIRERRGEYAVMQAVGFSRARILGLMIAENVMFCLLCAAVAIGAAHLLEPAFNVNLGSYVGRFEIEALHGLLTAVAALGVAAIISLVPAADLWRLDVAVAIARD